MSEQLSEKSNTKINIRGVNHIAMVCKDMKRTIDFYTNILGMPLIKTCDLPGGMGQHFFLDAGNGASMAFFWFPEAEEVEPGITVPNSLMGEMDGSVTTAIGSMNHVAFDVDHNEIPEIKKMLEDAGLKVSPILHHDDSPQGFDFENEHPTRWVSSIYFHDPDGIQLEFAGWVRKMNTETDVAHEPATADDRPRYLKMQEAAAEQMAKMMAEMADAK